MDASLGVMIFMGLVLKIPLAFGCWVIWKAIRDVPEPAESAGDDGGHHFRRFRREPNRPRGPRRGPHAPDALPLPCPQDGPLRVSRGAARTPRPSPAGRH